MLVTVLAFLLTNTTAASTVTAPEDFWSHWSDGRAEMNGYRLTQPRYGAARRGTAVLVFVKEDMSDSVRVKADPGRHPPEDVFPVLKLNAIRDFQTGIYDYNVMTSVFAEPAPGWPLAKVSFSSQEWCGHVYHQILFRQGGIESESHSYFDGEADTRLTLPRPADGLVEDALPIVLRNWGYFVLRPGESRDVPFLMSLLRARLTHTTLAWGRAKVSRSSDVRAVRVPAGAFRVVTFVVEPRAGSKLTYEVEAAFPFRLVRWSASDGEEAVLLGSSRLKYWELNGPGHEGYLREIGLGQ